MKTMMRIVGALMICLAMMFGATFVVGCDEQIAKQRTVEIDDDEVTTEETTVTKTREGDIEVEKKTKTTEYEDGQVKEERTKTETETYKDESR